MPREEAYATRTRQRATGSSEVAPSGESLVGLRPGALVHGEPLRSLVGYLGTAPVGDLELDAEVDLPVPELRDRLIEILDAVDEDWLVALEMPGEQRLPSRPPSFVILRGGSAVSTRTPAPAGLPQGERIRR